MPDIIIAVILGIVEGLTEFLPVSSTGHLIIVNRFFAFTPDFTNKFDIIIQFGAILAAMLYFHKQLLPIGNAKHKQKVFLLWSKAILGVLPALIIGYLLADTIDKFLFNPLTVAISLFLGGIFLIYIESQTRHIRIKSVYEISTLLVLAIGLIQCVAMIPGVSRSAATIIGAMLLGVSRAAAVEFSFFLAIPTIAAASAYSLLKGGLALSPSEINLLLLGFIVSFLAAWAVITVFMRYISHHDFKPFAWYRIILGILVLVFLKIGIL